ncbi:MAG: transposase [Spirochaetota bacterium]
MALNEFGEISMRRWLEIPMHYTNVSLDEYIIMPDHVHGIIIINDVTNGTVGAIHESPPQRISSQQPISPFPKNDTNGTDEYKKQRRKMTLPKIIGRFKMNTAKQINQLRQTPGTTVWQRNYYEHIIRDEHELNRIRHYIAQNPAKWRNDNNYF